MFTIHTLYNMACQHRSAHDASPRNGHLAMRCAGRVALAIDAVAVAALIVVGVLSVTGYIGGGEVLIPQAVSFAGMVIVSFDLSLYLSSRNRAAEAHWRGQILNRLPEQSTG